MPDVLVALRAFPRYRMLMLTLERIGVRHAGGVCRGGAAGAEPLRRSNGRRGVRGTR